jgi:hypothetical protein
VIGDQPIDGAAMSPFLPPCDRAIIGNFLKPRVAPDSEIKDIVVPSSSLDEISFTQAGYGRLIID